MSKKYLYVIILALIASNGYFLYQTYLWQKEWFEQLATTVDIEQIFMEQTDFSVTYDGLLSGENSSDYMVTKPHEHASKYGIDLQALKRGDTLLYFRDGEFIGSSKSNLSASEPSLLRIVNNLFD